MRVLLVVFLLLFTASCGKASVDEVATRVKKAFREGGVDLSQLAEIKEKNTWMIMERRILEKAKRIENMKIPPAVKDQYLKKILNSSVYGAIATELKDFMHIDVSILSLSRKKVLPLAAKYLFGEPASDFVEKQILTGRQGLASGSPQNPYFIVSFEGKPMFCTIYRYELKCDYVPGMLEAFKEGRLREYVVDLR